MVTPPIHGHPRVGGGCCGRTQAEARERKREGKREGRCWFRGSPLLEHFNIWQGPLRLRGLGCSRARGGTHLHGGSEERNDGVG